MKFTTKIAQSGIPAGTVLEGVIDTPHAPPALEPTAKAFIDGKYVEYAKADFEEVKP
jgi:hypothetical protein